MHNEYFGFTGEPFGVTPDSRFFYENPVYREAYTTLASGVRDRRGLMTLVGAVGTGKTTVLRHLMANLEPGVRCLLADCPPSSFDELLTFLCHALDVQAVEPRGRLDRFSRLKQALLESHTNAKNGTTALLLDEAQHLTDETLEGIRLLSNIETAGDKLVQIVLAGQPELSAKLDEPSLAAFKQRITFECRLDRLRYEEIAAYIDYRLSVAGYRGPDLFGSDAVEAIGFYSFGVPRLINVLCGNSLLRAQRAAERTVSSSVVVDVARALRIGPAFEYRVSRPIGANTAAPGEIASTPVWTDSPAMRSRGALYYGRLAASGRRVKAPERTTGGRRWLWVSLGCLGCIVLGTAGLALLRTHDSAIVIDPGPRTLRPAAVPASGGAKPAGSPDPPATRGHEWAAVPSPPTAGGAAPSARPEQAESPAVGGEAGQMNGHETPVSPPRDAIALRTEVMATPRSEEDTAEDRLAPSPSRWPTRQVVVKRGATISGIVWSAFGPQMFLALDLLKELNPQLDNLNWVLAGQHLRLPRLGRDDLVRANRDGSYRLIVNSLPNPADALTLGETVRAGGYDVVITPRKVSSDLILSRVEIRGLRDRAAAHRAWQTAVAAAWLPRQTQADEGGGAPAP